MVKEKSLKLGQKIKRIFRKKSKTNQSNKIIIVGGGDLGLSLATVLETKNQIVIIEKDKTVAEDIANRTNFMVINEDGNDPTVLKEAGLDKTDVLFAMTGDDRTNLMVCLMAKNAELKKIISVVNSPKNETLFSHAGITQTISKVESTVARARKALYEKSTENIIHLINNEAQVMELTVGKKSKFRGPVSKIKNAIVSAIVRKDGSKIIIPTPTTKIQTDDLIIVTAKTKDISDLLEDFKKE